jgi:hypothetical protein
MISQYLFKKEDTEAASITNTESMSPLQPQNRGEDKKKSMKKKKSKKETTASYPNTFEIQTHAIGKPTTNPVKETAGPMTVDGSFSFRAYTKDGDKMNKDLVEGDDNSDNEIGSATKILVPNRPSSSQSGSKEYPYKMFDDGRVCIVPGRIYWRPLSDDIRCEYDTCDKPAY